MTLDDASAKKALELAMAKLEKTYGKNTVILGNALPDDVPAYSTGCFKLDLGLGVGGLPRGRIIEIFGAEGLGKSLLALNTAASCQAEGGRVAYLDVECDLHPEWMRKMGVNTDDLLIAQPETGEETLEIAETLVKTRAVDLIVIDSVAAMSPKAEVEGTMEDNHVGLQARMMAQGLRKLREPIAETGTCFVFLNQIRDKIGFMQSGTTSPGGRALKFASSIRIELKRRATLTDNKTGQQTGIRVQATVLKNKLARPGVTVEYDVLHGHGINNFGCVLELSEQYGLITKRGSYYYKLGDEKHFGQGAQQAIEYLASDLDFTEKLKIDVKKAYFDQS